MRVIATAKIIPVRIRPFDRPPVLAVQLRLIVFLLYQDEATCAQTRAFAALGSGREEATCSCRFSPRLVATDYPSLCREGGVSIRDCLARLPSRHQARLSHAISGRRVGWE
jgi:hypothetical protein